MMTITVSEFLLMIIGLLGGTGIVGALIMRKLDRMGKKLDERDQAQIDESIVIITGLKAIGYLAEATSIAQRDGKTNGEMETAMTFYKDSRVRLNDYLTRQAARGTHCRRL